MQPKTKRKARLRPGLAGKFWSSAVKTAQNLDGVIAASETDHAYPSLSAQLHARLKIARTVYGAGCWQRLPGAVAGAVRGASRC